MADFVPPPGPPPPKVPEGWKAQWNDQYKEWFYVNIYTKQSQWERPTEPIYPPSGSGGAPDGPPPGYSNSGGRSPLPEKSAAYGSNNPYGAAGGGSNLSSDERLARKLQAEEEARAQGRPVSRGAADGYYGQQSSGSATSPVYGQQGASPNYGSQELPPRDEGAGKRGLFSKLLGKASGGGSGGAAYGQQQQYQPRPPQGYYPPPTQYGSYGPGQQYGYPPQQQGYYQQQQPPRKSGGLGAGGGAALGLGGGLLGGMMLGEMMDNGGGDGGDGGGDYGGGDGGGGDFGGGDGGGGDMGGGDF